VSSDPLTELPTTDRARLEAVLVEFDLRWTPDRLAAAVGQLPLAGAFRRAALREMVKIDLERHARNGVPLPLQDYLHRFPELGDMGTIPADLRDAEAAARDTLPRPGASGSVHLPKQFGRYRIVRPLGRGGMGGVYLARDGDLDRLVALKVPRFALDDPEAVERFQREARAAATIDHPNVCRVYDVGRIDGLPYITMAYVEGPTLADVLRDGPLTPRRAAEMARDIARALAEAHRRGVVHRDLKPANILMSGVRNQESGVRTDAALTPDSCLLTPVVTDFGLAARTTADDPRLTAEGTVAGTPPYMSPEQVAGDRAGPASDVYSLGAMLYEMATGRTPFTGSRADIFAQVLAADPAPPSAVRPDIDPRLDALVLKALAKRPQDRFLGMVEFADALDMWLSDTDIHKPSRSAHALRVGLGAMAALVLLGLAAVLIRQCGKNPPNALPTSPGSTTVTVTTTSIRSETTPPDAVQTSRPKIKLQVPRPKSPVKPNMVAEFPLKEPDQRIVAVAFSPDDRQVYTATKDKSYIQVRRWDAVSGEEEKPAKPKRDLLNWAVFGPEGRRYLAGGGLQYSWLNRSESGEEVQQFETGPHAVAGGMSRDGQRAIIGINTVSAGRRVRVYDVETGRSVGEYAGHKDDPHCVALSDDGRWAFSASPDRFAAWEVKTNVSQLQAGNNVIRCAAFVPNSGRVVVGTATGAVTVYDVTGPFKTDSMPGALKDGVTCLAISPDGRLVVAAAKDKTLRGWDPTYRWLTLVLTDLPEPVVAMAFSSKGTRLVTAGATSWRVWEVPE
jgi:serine/threonine protein kinase